MKCSVVGKVHGVSYCETSKRYNVRISGGKKNGSRNHGSHTTEAEAALAYNFLVLNRPPEASPFAIVMSQRAFSSGCIAASFV